MGEHATFSPSSLGALELCPGRHNAIRALPPEARGGPVNRSALEGTAQHEMLEQCATQRLDPKSFLGTDIAVEEAPNAYVPITITEPMVLAVQMALTYYLVREREYGAPGQYEVKVNPGAVLHEDIGLGPVRKPRDDCWGTADAVFKGKGYLEVVDFKSGYIFVPELCHQTAAYALGALSEHDLEKDGPIQRIRLTIIQPNGPGERIRTHEMTDTELMPWAVKLHDIIATAEDSAAMRAYGESQCKFCPAKRTCPEYLAATLGVLDTAAQETANAMNDTLPPPPPGGGPATPVNAGATIMDAMAGDIDKLSDTAIDAVLQAKDALLGWLKDVDAYALKRAMTGDPIPGWKPVAGSGSRSWSLPEEEMAAKLKNLNTVREDGTGGPKVKKADVYTTKLLSPYQAEQRLKPMVRPGAWGNIEKLIVKGPGKPTLVPESDPRPSIRPSVDEALGPADAAPDPNNALVREAPAAAPPPPAATPSPAPTPEALPSFLA